VEGYVDLINFGDDATGGWSFWFSIFMHDDYVQSGRGNPLASMIHQFDPVLYDRTRPFRREIKLT
jgi:hypothetical protein